MTALKQLPSLETLKARYKEEYAEYLKWGIHVMASQNGLGEITVGDSHEYALTFDPFDREFINTMILDYLATFAQFKSPKVFQTWHGIYPKMTNGNTEIVLKPEERGNYNQRIGWCRHDTFIRPLR